MMYFSGSRTQLLCNFYKKQMSFLNMGIDPGKFKVFISTLLIILSFISGCSDDPFEKECDTESYFHIKNEDYIIPLLVRGNTNSGKIIIYVQGGPGINSLDFAVIDYPEWKESLEKEYAVAYYDQRGTGTGQGNFDTSSISLSMYIEDLDAVAKFLGAAYNAEIIMLGHSFGGALIYRYLIEKGENAAASKYISADGPASNDRDSLRWIFNREFLFNTANIEIERERNTEKWNEVLDWLNKHPVIEDIPGNDPWKDKDQWNEYVDDLIYPYYSEKSLSLSDLFRALILSPYNPLPAYFGSKFDFDAVKRIFTAIYDYPLTENLSEINQDILLITGRYDDICPPEEMEFIYNSISSPIKQLEIIDDAGHESFIHQPDIFFNVVKKFVK